MTPSASVRLSGKKCGSAVWARATNSATAPCDGIPLAHWVGGSSCLDAQSAGTRFSARRPIVLRETSSLAKSQKDSQG